VGLGTFVDPRLGGGRINDVTTEERVSLMPIDGEEYLFYKALPLQVAFLRGTTADTLGNISMEREALTLEALAIATAVRNSGGLVIVQVERLAEQGTLHPKDVKIPGIMVDCVVVCDDPDHHWQTFRTVYNPAYSGEIRAPMASPEPLPLSARKIITRRAAFELAPNSVVNLGIGMPEGVGSVASEERILELMTLTAEPGVIGGLPAGGLDFGAALNTQAIIDQPAQFDFYDGGGLERVILALMDFTPLMPEPPRPMDDRIFREAPMGLRDVLLSQPLAQRLSLDERDDIFFINFENLRISTREDVEAIEHEVETRLAPLGRRVYAIVNYMTTAASTRPCSRPIPRWCAVWRSASIRGSRATPPAVSCAASSAMRWRHAPSRHTSMRTPRKRGHT
jgi:acyl CoA:acetate/3-ketoacid CoA transferase